MEKLRGFVFNIVGRAIEVKLTAECADDCFHQGDCESGVNYWVKQLRPYLDKIPADIVAGILKPYGAWDEEELQDHEQNLVRFLWSVAGTCHDQKCDKEWRIRRNWLWAWMDC